MNFESYAYKNMTSDSFYEYVKQHIVPNKRMYFFFDEVQRVPDWEDAVNSFSCRFQLRYLCHKMPICSPLNMPPIYLEDA